MIATLTHFKQPGLFRSWLNNLRPEVVPLFAVEEHLEVETWLRSGKSPRRPAAAESACAPRNAGRKLTRFVTDPATLADLVTELEKCEFIGLDVETCMRTQRLCLIQIATEQFVAIIDALAVCDLSPLAGIFASSRIVKIIHSRPAGCCEKSGPVCTAGNCLRITSIC